LNIRALIEVSGEVKAARTAIATRRSRVEQLRGDLAAVEREMRRFLDRKKAAEKVELIEKKLLSVRYMAKVEEQSAVKKDIAEAQAQLEQLRKEIRPSEAAIADLEERKREVAVEATRVRSDEVKTQRDAERDAERAEDAEQRLQEVNAKIKANKQAKKRAEEDIARTKSELEALEARHRTLPKVDPEELRRVRAEAKEFRAKVATADGLEDDVRANMARVEKELAILEEKLKRLGDRKFKIVNQLASFPAFRDIRAAYEYFQAHSAELKNPAQFLGPIAAELGGLSALHASYVNHVLPITTSASFVTGSEEDYRMMIGTKAKMGWSGLSFFTVDAQGKAPPRSAPPLTEEARKKLGLECFLDETFKTHELVATVLKSMHSIQNIACGTEKTEALDPATNTRPRLAHAREMYSSVMVPTGMASSVPLYSDR
jgi:hypothetical protein